MWGEHERRNEWKFKNILWKENRENQNSKVDYKKKTRKSWKWIVIGGNAHSLKSFGKSLKSNCEKNCVLVWGHWTYIVSDWPPIAHNIIVSVFSMFSNMI